ncbi:hypothetical protein Bca52824_022643 [Brassica carinata]|uniref:Uncharacterized protein n=1 Tax=Brassica carinata TaxID=52824 RepID=A0A8X7VGX5_BRACI|nr:hypothetical protein Bca52824_022643 [Brassica carinata]
MKLATVNPQMDLNLEGMVLGLFGDGRYKSESQKSSVDIIGFGTGPELEKKSSRMLKMFLTTFKVKVLTRKFFICKHRKDFGHVTITDQMADDIGHGNKWMGGDLQNFLHITMDLAMSLLSLKQQQS